MTNRTSYHPWHTDTWRTLTHPAYRLLDAIVRTAPSPTETEPSESFSARRAAALSAADDNEGTRWAAIAELHDAGVVARGSRTNPVLRPHRSAMRVLRLQQCAR